MKCETGVEVPIFKQGQGGRGGGSRVCTNYWVIKLLSLPREVYSNLTDCGTSDPEGGMLIRPGRETATRLFTLVGSLVGSWEFAHRV